MKPAIDPEELGELPPLEDQDRDESEGPTEDDPLPLLTPLEEDVDLDEDERAPDVDLGLEVDENETDADEPGDFVLDMAELLSPIGEDERPEDSDTAGPPSLDLSADLETGGDDLLGSNEEGTDEPFEDLVSEDLPELDADEPGGLENEPSWLPMDALRDEELPSRGPTWKHELVDVPGFEHVALALGPLGVVTAGSGVAFIEAPEQPRVGLGSARAVGVTPIGSGVVCLTAGGELSAVRLGRGATPLSGWRDCLGVRAGDNLDLGLGALGPGTFAVHAHSSRLAISRDEGAHFEPIELGGNLIALSGDFAPARALLRSAEGPAISSLHAERWEQVELDAVADDVASGESMTFAARGQWVALASPERGLVVSSDGGRSFGRVSGCLHVTALALGERAGVAKVWVALFVESEERALVVEVDAVTRDALVIAELVAEGDDDDDLDCRVLSLLWDPDKQKLWAASTSRLVSLAPPSL